jgi:hypothetical protein
VTPAGDNVKLGSVDVLIVERAEIAKYLALALPNLTNEMLLRHELRTTAEASIKRARDECSAFEKTNSASLAALALEKKRGAELAAEIEAYEKRLRQAKDYALEWQTKLLQKIGRADVGAHESEALRKVTLEATDKYERLKSQRTEFDKKAEDLKTLETKISHWERSAESETSAQLVRLNTTMGPWDQKHGTKRVRSQNSKLSQARRRRPGRPTQWTGVVRAQLHGCAIIGSQNGEGDKG